jgi:hypothetical protein
MTENWLIARKKPIMVEFREVVGDHEVLETSKGLLAAAQGRDFIIREINGESYPMSKDKFFKTFDIIKGEKTECLRCQRARRKL